jgi:nucleoside-triphosphatase THEP1
MIALPPPDRTGVVILISGERRVGKTTLLLHVRAGANRLRLGGFLSVARFEGDEKTGIDLMDAATGEITPLAVAESDGTQIHTNEHILTNEVMTGHYRFNPGALAAGLRYATAGQGADVFLVDELGPLELLRGEGWADVIPMIRARDFGAALVVVRPELIEVAREQMRLPPETPVITVNEDNRAAVAAALVDWIGQRPGPSAT